MLIIGVFEHLLFSSAFFGDFLVGKIMVGILVLFKHNAKVKLVVSEHLKSSNMNCRVIKEFHFAVLRMQNVHS